MAEPRHSKTGWVTSGMTGDFAMGRRSAFEVAIRCCFDQKMYVYQAIHPIAASTALELANQRYCGRQGNAAAWGLPFRRAAKRETLTLLPSAL
jgi:hypothetical protein